MGDLTVDKKLELVRQVKEQYARNQSDLSRREQILYGIPNKKIPRQEWTEDQALDEAIQPAGSFKLRFMLAVILFAAMVYWGNSGKEIAGISVTEVYAAIETQSLLAQSVSDSPVP